MKTKSSPLITASITAFLLTKTFALEAPADDAPPPPLQKQAQTLPHFDLSKPEIKAKEKIAFLGVVSGEVPAVLVDQLNLKNGEGVLIRALAPDSPAARAGITTNDVITKISGQPVGSPKEISAQISTHQPDESIKIELIHKGQPTTLDITLGNKPAELANAEQEERDSPNLDGFPQELADRVRGAIAGNVGGLNLDADAVQLPPQVGRAIRKLQLHLQGAAGQAGGLQPMVSGVAKLESHAGATIKMMDEQGSIEVKTRDGSKEVTIRDQNSNVTWSGPWDTAQDKAAAPAKIRKRVDGLNLDPDFESNGIHLNMRQVPPPVDGNQD
jgi:serine protease Do